MGAASPGAPRRRRRRLPPELRPPRHGALASPLALLLGLTALAHLPAPSAALGVGNTLPEAAYRNGTILVLRIGHGGFTATNVSATSGGGTEAAWPMFLDLLNAETGTYLGAQPLRNASAGIGAVDPCTWPAAIASLQYSGRTFYYLDPVGMPILNTADSGKVVVLPCRGSGAGSTFAPRSAEQLQFVTPAGPDTSVSVGLATAFAGGSNADGLYSGTGVGIYNNGARRLYASGTGAVSDYTVYAGNGGFGTVSLSTSILSTPQIVSTVEYRVPQIVGSSLIVSWVSTASSPTVLGGLYALQSGNPRLSGSTPTAAIANPFNFPFSNSTGGLPDPIKPWGYAFVGNGSAPFDAVLLGQDSQECSLDLWRWLPRSQTWGKVWEIAVGQNNVASVYSVIWDLPSLTAYFSTRGTVHSLDFSAGVPWDFFPGASTAPVLGTLHRTNDPQMVLASIAWAPVDETAYTLPSPTPSVTPSLTPTSSPSSSRTPSITPSGTVTPTLSRTPSRTGTPTASVTRTAAATVSPTGTPSVTPSITPTSTATPSGSATRTRSPVSPSATPSQSPSSTVTWSVTPSTTPSGTITKTPTNSVTVTATRSPTITVTGSVTPTRSPSNSLTPSGTATPSALPTGSPTGSATPSVAATPTSSSSFGSSRTPTPSVSATVSFSKTVTPSSTVSGTATGSSSASPTGSGTRSATVSSTVSVTISGSPSASATGTCSTSPSRSATATISGSASRSASGTPTGSVTSTRSGTPSATASESSSASASPSESASGSASASASPSASRSASLTPSGTTSTSASPSATPSLTRSGSRSTAPTKDPTRSPTPTASLTPSSTVTASMTVTLGSSATRTASPSATPTSSSSASVSTSASASVTPTLSLSQSVPASTSPTASVSRTISGSPTVSASGSATASGTDSTTPTGSPSGTSSKSGTPSRSASGTPTRSKSGSRSASISASPSASASWTPSPSASGSTTPSGTPSTSITPSGSVTASCSATASSSGTGTPSGSVTASTSSSASATASATASSSATGSVSFGSSPSATPSGTGSSTLTPTNTGSSTGTPSGTPSASVSGSASPSATPSSSVTASGTPSSSPTSSVSASSSASSSASASPTPTTSVSFGSSASATPSGTGSSTGTPSGTPSNSGSPSGTPSSTLTPSGSASVSASASLTPSLTPSGSATPSSTVTPSGSVSASVTPTPSPSASTSPSMTATRTASLTSGLSQSPSPSLTPSSSASPSVTPSTSASRSVTPSTSASATTSASTTASLSPSPSPKLSMCETGRFGMGPLLTCPPLRLGEPGAVAAALGAVGPSWLGGTAPVFIGCGRPAGTRLDYGSTAAVASAAVSVATGNDTAGAAGASSTPLASLAPTTSSSSSPSSLSGYPPVGQGTGDVCLFSCGGAALAWGPAAFVCDSDGRWVPVAPRVKASNTMSTIVAVLAATTAASRNASGSLGGLPLDGGVEYRPDCGLRAAVVGGGAALPPPQCYAATATAPVLSDGSQCGSAAKLVWVPSARAAWAPAVVALAPGGVTAAVAANATGTARTWLGSAEGLAQLTRLRSAAGTPGGLYRVWLGAFIDLAAGVAPGAPGLPALPVPPYLAAQGKLIVAATPVLDVAETEAMQARGSVVAVVMTLPSALASTKVAAASALQSLGVAASAPLTYGLLTEARPAFAEATNTSAPVLISGSDGSFPPFGPSAITGQACGFVSAVLPKPPLLGEVSASASSSSSLTARLLVSDALPSTSFSLALPAAPAPKETVTITCAPSAALAGRLTLSPLKLTIDASTYAGLATKALKVTVTPRFSRSAPGAAAEPSLLVDDVSCSVASVIDSTTELPVYNSVPPVSVQVVSLLSRWPFFSEAVLELPDGSLRSAWYKPGTAALSSSSSSLASNASAVTTGTALGYLPAASLVVPLANATAAEVEALVRAVALPPRVDASLLHTLSTSSNVTLVADGYQWVTTSASSAVSAGGRLLLAAPPAAADASSPRARRLAAAADAGAAVFTPATRVFVGSVEANVSWVSADGRLLRFASPRFADVCGSGSGDGASAGGGAVDCGSQSITIVNPTPPDAAATVNALLGGAAVASVASAEAAAALRLGTAVSCPPFCPGLGGGAVPVAAVDAAAASTVAALLGSPAGAAALTAAAGVLGACNPTTAPVAATNTTTLRALAGAVSSTSTSSSSSSTSSSSAGGTTTTTVTTTTTTTTTSSSGSGSGSSSLAALTLPAALVSTAASVVVSDASTPRSALPLFLMAPRALPASLSLSGMGLYYTARCEYYTDPATGACTNTSHPLFAGCAFGSGDSCQPCPANAICPGGRRAYPLPGAWSPAITSADVITCAPPAGRCLGWNETSQSIQCGPLYSGVGCRVCAPGLYPADGGGGGCVPCPPNQGAWTVLQPLLIFAGILAGVALVIFCLVLIIVMQVGGTVAGGVKRTVQFIISTVTVLQVVIQVGRATQPGLPSFIRQFYATISFLQLVGLTLHPECLGTNPFQTELILFGLTLGLLLILVGTLVMDKSMWPRVGAFVRSWSTRLPSIRSHRPHSLDARARTLAPLFVLGSGGETKAEAPGLVGHVPKPSGSSAGSDASDGQAADKSGGSAGDGNALVPASDAAVAPPPPGAPAPGAALFPSRRAKAAAIIRKLCFTILALLYATVTNNALRTVHCETKSMTVRTYLDLDVDGRTLLDAGIRVSVNALAYCAGNPKGAGCGPALGALEARVDVPLLYTNPSIVCGEKSHRVAAGLAVAVLIAYTFIYPLVTLWVVSWRVNVSMWFGAYGPLWRRARQFDAARQERYVRAGRSRLQRFARLLGVVLCGLGKRYGIDKSLKTQRKMSAATVLLGNNHDAYFAQVVKTAMEAVEKESAAEKAGKERAGEGGASSGSSGGSSDALVPAPPAPRKPLKRAAGGRTGITVTDATASTLLVDVIADDLEDHNPDILRNVSLSYFTANDFRVSRHYFRQLDLATLLTLSLLLVLWSEPASIASAAGKAVATIVPVATLGGLIIVKRPFALDRRYQHPVKLTTLLLSILAALLNFFNFVRYGSAAAVAAAAGDTNANDSDIPLGILILSIATFVVSCGLGLVLVIAFFAALARGAAKEKKARLLARRASKHESRHVPGSGSSRDNEDDDDDGKDGSSGSGSSPPRGGAGASAAASSPGLSLRAIPGFAPSAPSSSSLATAALGASSAALGLLPAGATPSMRITDNPLGVFNAAPTLDGGAVVTRRTVVRIKDASARGPGGGGSGAGGSHHGGGLWGIAAAAAASGNDHASSGDGASGAWSMEGPGLRARGRAGFAPAGIGAAGGGGGAGHSSTAASGSAGNASHDDDEEGVSPGSGPATSGGPGFVAVLRAEDANLFAARHILGRAERSAFGTKKSEAGVVTSSVAARLRGSRGAALAAAAAARRSTGSSSSSLLPVGTASSSSSAMQGGGRSVRALGVAAAAHGSAKAAASGTAAQRFSTLVAPPPAPPSSFLAAPSPGAASSLVSSMVNPLSSRTLTTASSSAASSSSMPAPPPVVPAGLARMASTSLTGAASSSSSAAAGGGAGTSYRVIRRSSANNLGAGVATFSRAANPLLARGSVSGAKAGSGSS